MAEKRRRTPYTLKSPCADCPFRSDRPFHLTPERADEIADHLRSNDSDFHCHKTVDYSSDDGEGRVASKTRVCAGALITMEKENVSTQAMRIAERLGLYDHSALDMDAPVYDSLEQWQRSFRPESEQADDEASYEHCGVVAPGCEDPAGYSVGGNVYGNPEDGSVHPDHTCQFCGSECCDNCTARTEEERWGNGTLMLFHTCVYCAEEE